jgi:hypothetical protein
MIDRSDEPFRNVTAAEEPAPTYRCPCCGFKTLYGRGADEICPVCFWHDDGQDEHDADLVRGGPNGHLSLRDAQRNFLKHRAYDLRYITNVRDPLPDER